MPKPTSPIKALALHLPPKEPLPSHTSYSYEQYQLDLKKAKTKQRIAYTTLVVLSFAIMGIIIYVLQQNPTFQQIGKPSDSSNVNSTTPTTTSVTSTASATPTNSASSCIQSQFLIQGKCVDNPFHVSTNSVINQFVKGCTLFQPISDSKLQSLMDASCNSHSICYQAIDALNYTLGVGSVEHRTECDTILLDNLSKGCAIFPSGDSLKNNCENITTLWKTLVTDSAKQYPNDTFSAEYIKRLNDAQKLNGTATGVTPEWRTFLLPFRVS